MPSARTVRSLADAASVALGAPPLVTTAIAAVTHGGARFWWVVATVVSAVIKFTFDQRRTARDREAKVTADDARINAEDVAAETRWRTNLAMSDAFSPLLACAARIIEATDQTDRERQHARLIASVINAAVKIIGPDQGVRACYFSLELDEDDAPLRLVPDSSVGRADEPKSRFEAGTPAGAALIEMILQDGHQFAEDVDEHPPVGWDGHEHVYRTFLSVAARGAEHVVGMLSVDALQPGDLDEERDQPVLRVLGRILGLSQALSIPAAPGPSGMGR